jgi:hypothetical protein
MQKNSKPQSKYSTKSSLHASVFDKTNRSFFTRPSNLQIHQESNIRLSFNKTRRNNPKQQKYSRPFRINKTLIKKKISAQE